MCWPGRFWRWLQDVDDRFWRWLMRVEEVPRPSICNICDRPLIPLVINGTSIIVCDRCDGVIEMRKAARRNDT